MNNFEFASLFSTTLTFFFGTLTLDAGSSGEPISFASVLAIIVNVGYVALAMYTGGGAAKNAWATRKQQQQAKLEEEPLAGDATLPSMKTTTAPAAVELMPLASQATDVQTTGVNKKPRKVTFQHSSTATDAMTIARAWKRKLDRKTGRWYCVNKITKKTSWKKPEGFVDRSGTSTAHSAATSGPVSGWVEKHDAKTGRFYYSNRALRKTRWKVTMPLLLFTWCLFDSDYEQKCFVQYTLCSI